MARQTNRSSESACLVFWFFVFCFTLAVSFSFKKPNYIKKAPTILHFLIKKNGNVCFQSVTLIIIIDVIFINLFTQAYRRFMKFVSKQPYLCDYNSLDYRQYLKKNDN